MLAPAADMYRDKPRPRDKEKSMDESTSPIDVSKVPNVPSMIQVCESLREVLSR